MPKPSKKFKFGEWLPDQPALDNPGVIEALNVLRDSGNYVSYDPLVGTGTAVAQTVLYAKRATGNGGSVVYVGASSGGANKLYTGTGSGAASWTDRTPAGLSTSVPNWSIAQYNETVIATNFTDFPQFHILGAGGNFAQLTGAFGAAPKAAVVGIIGQFVMLGNLGGIAPYAVQWSGINAPLDWPTPNSAQAIAEQSGRQYLEANLGTVYGISQGDQWGLALLDGGVVRITYAGGGVVFQFDTIYKGLGPIGANAWIKIGQLVYYASLGGFFATDGTSVNPIGRQKVDNYFLARYDESHPNDVRCGVHWSKRLVYWTFPVNGGTGVNSEMIIYNIDEQKWTHVMDGVQCFVLEEEALIVGHGIEAFTTVTRQCGVFVGFPGTAVLTSPEIEFNPGGRTFVQGILPQASGAIAISVRLGSRNSLSDAVNFTPAQTPDNFTQSAGFFVDNRYHRAEISLTGLFTQAIGGEFDAKPSSSL